MKKITKNRFIVTTKIGPKGQIVIPKIARKMFNLKEGDTLLLLGDLKKGIAIIRESDFYKKVGV